MILYNYDTSSKIYTIIYNIVCIHTLIDAKKITINPNQAKNKFIKLLATCYKGLGSTSRTCYHSWAGICSDILGGPKRSWACTCLVRARPRPALNKLTRLGLTELKQNTPGCLHYSTFLQINEKTSLIRNIERYNKKITTHFNFKLYIYIFFNIRHKSIWDCYV